MSNEEIVKEIDEATSLMRETKKKVNETLNKARAVFYREEQIPYEEAYNKGLEDAWKCARKIFTTDCATLQKVLGSSDEGTIIMLNEPQAMLAKLEAYEKEQNEIKAGYVYEIMGKFCVVVQVDEFNKEYHIIWCDGGTDKIPFDAPIGFKKTGNHIDIQSILQQIGSDIDELS